MESAPPVSLCKVAYVWKGNTVQGILGKKNGKVSEATRLCKQCNAAKKGKHPTAPSRPPAAIGKRSPYVCKLCGLPKKGHMCKMKK